MRIEKRFYILNSHKIVANTYLTSSSQQSIVQQQQQQQQHTNYSTSALNTILKNRNALPNIPMQSTFKSLLSIPINSTNSTSNTSNAQNGANTKVYFRPQDLSSSKANSTSSSQNVNNELYLLQKNTIEKVPTDLSSIGTVVTPSLPPPPTSTGRRISTKNLLINTSSTPSSPKPSSNEIESTPSQNEILRNTNLVNLITQPVLSSPTTPLNLKSTTTTTTNTNINVTTKTTTYTTSTTEQLNSMVHRAASPSLNNNLGEHQISNSTPSLNTITNNTKLKSWSSVQQTTNKTPTPDAQQTSRDQAQSPALTNWKSTAAQSNQSEKQIIIDYKNEVNINNFINNLNINNNHYQHEEVIIKDRTSKSRNSSPSKVSHERPNDPLSTVLLPNKLNAKLGNLEHKNLEDFLNEKIEKINHRDETISAASYLETISDSTETPIIHKRLTKKVPSELGKIFSGLNDAKLNFKSSSNTTESTQKNQNGNENAHNNMNQNLRASPVRSQNNAANKNYAQNLNSNNTNTLDPTLDRPPGRLNYYDSDTNTFSEGFLATSNLIKRSNSEYLHKKLNKGKIDYK